MTKRSSPIAIPNPGNLPRIVVIGGGFAGLSFLNRIRDQDYQVVLVDRNNFHQFQPLLYQVTMSALEPDSIVFPLRKEIRGRQNVRFVYGELEEIDPDQRIVYTEEGCFHYDEVLIGTGTVSNFFGLEKIKKNAFAMKDVRQSLNIRHFILTNLEKAAIAGDEKERDAYTNFVIVGGGPTGVELAGSLAEFKRYILPSDYPEYDPGIMEIFLIEAGDRLLKGMSEKASRIALKHLQDMGVEVKLNELVEDYDGDSVVTRNALRISARNFIWTAGVKADFPEGIPKEMVVEGNRLEVDPYLQVKALPHVYAMGDVAAMRSEAYPNGHPQLAQAAIQQGDHLARNFNRIARKKAPKPFSYVDKGALATIGKRRAVADIGRFRFDGYLAWLLWSLVHLVQISGFRNKFLVGLNWAWSYFSYEKGNRLIIRKRQEKKPE